MVIEKILVIVHPGQIGVELTLLSEKSMATQMLLHQIFVNKSFVGRKQALM
jgi:hypothetical protein